MEAELLLLDEPFASLDVPTRTGLRQWLRRLADERGVSIVMVTHDLDDAIRMSDRVLVLVDGCIKLQSRAGGASIASDPDLEQLRSLLAAAMI
jgi:sulfate transport system ATP-binding protein